MTTLGRWSRIMPAALYVLAASAFGEAVAVGGRTPSLAQAAAPGWPQWQGPRRDGVSEEKGLLQTWPEGGPRLLWKAAGIGRGFSSPVVSGGAIYITGDTETELVISSFTTDGQPRWRTVSGAAWKKNFPGSRASCCFDGGQVYHLNAYGVLVCLNAETGAKIWGVNLLARYEAKNITWGISESVLVHGDRVFATPAGAKGLVVALDKRTGEDVWATPAIEGEQAAYAAPILVDEGNRKVLVNCASAHTFGVDAATGALLWSVPHVDEKNTVNVTPVLWDGRLIVNNTSRDYGAVYALEPKDNAMARAWLCELKIGHGGILCVDGRLYGASSKGKLNGWVSIDVRSGEIAAADASGALSEGSALFADGRLYLLTARGLMTLQAITSAGYGL